MARIRPAGAGAGASIGRAEQAPGRGPLRVGGTAGGLRSSVSNGLATTMLRGRSPSGAMFATSELVGTPG